MFSITIDGIERKTSIEFQSLSIQNKINNEADTCSFTVNVTPSKTYKPNLNDEVIVTKDGVKLFGGVIIKMNDTVNAGGRIVYNVTCADYSFLLKRQLVVERYIDSTVIDIINDLITNYTDDGFTQNNVTYDRDIASFSFNNLTVSQCLDKLAKATNGYWYVDYDKDLHFFAKNSEISPFDLSDDSENYIFESLRISDDLTQLRNKITVRGGTNPSVTTRTEEIIVQADGQAIFPLGYKFAEKPTVSVNGTPITVGAEFLSDDADVDVQWSFQEKYIRFTDGNFPLVDDVVVVEAKILIPVIVRTPDNISVGEYGVFEYKIEDETIKTYDEAIERAITELNAYANELHEGSFETYNSGLKAGQRIKITSIARDKDIEAIIQSVSLNITDVNADQIKYSINFATTKTLGIIEYIQQSLINEKLDEDTAETLLNFLKLEDSFNFAMKDIPTIQSLFALSYTWTSGTNVLIWNLGSWAYQYYYGEATWGFSTWAE